MLECRVKDVFFLRLIEKRHVEKFYEFLENNREYFTGILHFIDNVKDKTDVINIIKKFSEMILNGTGFAWAIWHEDKIVGTISIRDINEELKSAEIAYSIDYRYEGKGIVSESCWIAIDYLFTEYDVERLVLGCDVKNIRSQNIAKKYGFTNEGVARKGFIANGEFQDIYIWSLLREEYLKLKNNRA
jgi:ribosomal-protein-serine acetyltransferase